MEWKKFVFERESWLSLLSSNGREPRVIVVALSFSARVLRLSLSLSHGGYDRFRHTYPLETRTKGYLPIEFLHPTFFLTITFCNNNKLDLHTYT